MDLIDTHVTAWVPVRATLWNERLIGYAEALDDFRVALPILLPLVRSELSQVEACVDRPPRTLLKRLSARDILVRAKQTVFLRVSAKFTYDRDVFKEQNPDHELEDELFLAIAAMYLGEAIEVLLIFSELSHPGRIETTEGIVTTQRGDSARVKAKSAFNQLWFPDDGDPTWPPLRTLPLQQVIGWLSGTSFFKQSLAVTRIERTLAAFTQMVRIGPYKEGELLFRSMQSLEAFYCDGTGDLRKQLAEKSSMWLGPWLGKKNVVGHLYDMRSKFVHGSAKLQYWTDLADPWEEDEKHMRSFSNSVVQAARLVVATLQRCIADEVHTIEWSYSVKASKLGT